MKMEEEEEHLFEVSLDPDTTCSICYAEFLESDDLATHIKQVHWTESCRQCQFCPSVFISLDHYAVHLRDSHILNLRICKYCYKVFNDFDTMKKHEVKHFNRISKSTYQCSQCISKFYRLYQLRQHEFDNHNNSLEGVFLDEIHSILSSKLNMKATTFLTSLGMRSVFICPVCVFTSENPSKYLEHLHSEKCRSLVCDKCSNVYESRKGLMRHLKNHKGCFNFIAEDELMKQCPKCEQSIEISRYQEHLKACNPIRCNLCQCIMKSVSELTMHQTTEHPMAIQMRICELCQGEFVGNTALQRHFDRRHKHEIHLYKYKCVECNNYYFKHPQKLFSHFFTKHIDLMPYCCKICNLKFRIRKKLTIHIKLVHNSVGFVEFDENYHVYFTETKSAHPFTPKCLFPDLLPKSRQDSNDLDAENAIQTDLPTDVPTDTEEKKITEKKPIKLRYKEELSKTKIANVLTDANANQSEAQTENENNKPMKRNEKQRLLKRKTKTQSTYESKASSDSEDEPLIKIKRGRQQLRQHIVKQNNLGFKTKIHKKTRDRLTCKLCKKYCYTFLNYSHHMTLHSKDEKKKCIICSEEFFSKTALNRHIAETHSSSRLTETLKLLLERRKMTKEGTLPELTPSEKFKKTIKRVKADNTVTSVTVKEVTDKLPVQKFIEEFMPDPDEANKETKSKINSIGTVTVRQIHTKISKRPVLKITKFIPKPPPTHVKLAMPTRFKDVASEKFSVRVKVIQKPPAYVESDNDQTEDNIHYEAQDDEIDIKHEVVPEVAQEVMLETQEQQPKPLIMPQKIVLPKLPKNYSSNDIKIAHLLPEAPFFKIVKMADVIKQTEEAEKAEQGVEEKKEEEDEDLPTGTKLVNVNPLAHLLGDTPVEQIVGKKSKYYKPKKDNLKKAVAKALMKLENTPRFKRKKVEQD